MIFGIWRIIATIIFMYLIWRNLREDYQPKDLIVYGWGLILAFLAAGRLTFGFINWGIWNENWWDWLSVWSQPGFSYYGGYIGILLFGFYMAGKKGWKLWNLAEDSIFEVILYLIFLLAGELVMAAGDVELAVKLGLLVLVGVLVLIITPRYRSYQWYFSGKKGFVFFWANWWWAIASLIASFWLKESLYIKMIYGIWGLISVGGLVILGEVDKWLKVFQRNRK